MGRGQLEPYVVKSLGVTAQGLRHMEILTQNTTTLNIIGCNVNVPQPGAYILHKLVINEERKPGKKEKDIESVKDMLVAIRQNSLYTKQISFIYKSLTVKQQRKINFYL